MTPLIHHKLDLKRVSSTGIQILNERDRQLTPRPLIWCIRDRVEVTNSKLNVKPYRYEPP